ncbi:MAG: acyl carrier protein [Myxococcales bacterium]|nr:acyl carrier protein [Myxococcales bacterium]
MTREDASELVVRTLSEAFEIPRERLTDDAHLFNDLGIDSIDAVDLLARLGKTLGRRIPPESFRSARSVGDVINAVAALDT